MEIQCNRLDRGYQLHQSEFEEKALEVLRSGNYILGQELESFEKIFAKYIGSNYCIGVGCGLDAIRIATHLLGICAGDEVIVPANTYIASILGLTLSGVVPVLIEPDCYYNIDVERIEEKITAKTKAIMAVHLYGQPAEMEVIKKIAQKYELKLLEDCAQAHGARFFGKHVGTFGDVGCFSFYPTKNMGAFGDGGAIVTNSEELHRSAKRYRNYGSEKKDYFCEQGVNSRLDELQAGLLRVQLKYLDEYNVERSNRAQLYTQLIRNDSIIIPMVRDGARSAWHQYVIRIINGRRQQLKQHLLKKGIKTMVHYPIPPHLSGAYSDLGLRKGALPITEQLSREILSLPMYNGMTEQETLYVIEQLNSFV